MTFHSNCDSCIRSIKEALERYFGNDINDNIIICIIPLCPEKLCSNDGWHEFLSYIKKEVQSPNQNNSNQRNSISQTESTSTKSNNSIINCLSGNPGIIFYTTENIPRGDYTDSIYNESRMLRNFFENTTYAKTANHENLIEKVKELIVDIKNKGKKNFNEIFGDLKNLLQDGDLKNLLQDEKLDELSKIYTYQSFHTSLHHNTLREFGDYINSETNFSKVKKVLGDLNKNKNETPNINTHIKSNDIENLEKIVNNIFKFREDHYLKRQKHDIASIIAANPLRFQLLKILVIDDNPDAVESDFKKIKNFLPSKTQIFITAQNEYRKFLNDKDFIKSLFNGKAKLELKEIKNSTKPFKKTNLFKNNKFKFDYVIVDLLLGHYNEGNKIIRELINLRTAINKNKKHYKKSFFFILVLSLSDDVDDIFRAYNEGALGYVWKFGRIYQLPALIGIFEEYRQKLIDGIGISAHSHARNFSKLYHLPPEIEWRLRTEYFLAPIVKKDKYEIEDVAKDVAKNWIKQIPKAELHYHLGGSMDEKIIFYLSVNTVAHLCEKYDKNCKNGRNVLKSIINEIKSLVNRFDKDDKKDKYEKFFRNFYNKCRLDIDKNECKNNSDIKTWLENLYNTKEKTINYLIKHEDKPAEVWFDYLTYKVNKDKNPEKQIKKSDLIAVFFVYAGILEGRTIEDAKKFWEELKEKVESLKNTNFYSSSPNIKEFITKTKIYSHFYSNRTINIPALKNYDLQSIFNNKSNNKKSENVLKSLILASPEAKTLNQLLRGDVFFGADNLQYYENIFACVWYLMEQAVEDNVRYLEIRVSPSGYTRKELTINEAVQALFEGADLCSLYFYLCKGKFIWTNFITTAKRHKSPYERAIEIGLAITYSKRDKKVFDLQKKVSSVQPSLLYNWKASRIVGVDLAGYEKDFPPRQFVNDFQPIFKICSFVTIHAGEETSAEYIWEAVFELHSNRIGHGLSIVEHPSLMSLARDTQICIELCPYSNIVTNNLRGHRISKYPLYTFMQEGINVTINTDDCATTGKTLSDEYVNAAELYYFSDNNSIEYRNGQTKRVPLTKWEVLRLVKAGFDNAFIKREEKMNLLRCVEEEIYQKVLQGYEIEPVYYIDRSE